MSDIERIQEALQIHHNNSPFWCKIPKEEMQRFAELVHRRERIAELRGMKKLYHKLSLYKRTITREMLMDLSTDCDRQIAEIEKE
jgi:hypothetical protein